VPRFCLVNHIRAFEFPYMPLILPNTVAKPLALAFRIHIPLVKPSENYCAQAAFVLLNCIQGFSGTSSRPMAAISPFFLGSRCSGMKNALAIAVGITALPMTVATRNEYWV
jgi:hypothetical protein